MDAANPMKVNDEPESLASRVFVSDGFRFDIYATQVSHRDYGKLYLAWREVVGKPGPRTRVILKAPTCQGNKSQKERLLEEVKIASYLVHENIAGVYGFASRGEDVFVVGEHRRGCYLQTAMDYSLLLNRKLSPAFAAYVVSEVANALDYAHRLSVPGVGPLHLVHRAVSPMNIRLDFDGSVLLTNFGAAYSDLRDRLVTPPGLMRGDPAYSSPELLRAIMSGAQQKRRASLANVDGRSDVFSLGLLLLEMCAAEYALDPSDTVAPVQPASIETGLTSETPTWTHLNVLATRLLRFNTRDIEPLLERVPAGLSYIVCRALDPNPAERCDAGKLRAELRSYLDALEGGFNRQSAAQELRSLQSDVKKAKRMFATPIERTGWVDDEDANT